MMFQSGHQLLDSLLTASLMMGTVGILAYVFLRAIPIQSWRLRSCLAAVVLVQGVMIIRTPIHLGLVEATSAANLMSDNRSIPPLNEWVGDTVTDSNQSAAGNSLTSGSTETDHSTGIGKFVELVGWSKLLIFLWLSVIVGVSVVSLHRYLSLVKQLRTLKPAPIDWQKHWKSLLRQSRRVSDVRSCEMLVSRTAGPVIVRGLRKYSLIVPEEYWQRLTEDQRHGVLLHELAHLERRDVWRQLAVRIIAVVHWINPLAWWAVREYEQAAEHACDQRVTQAGKRVANGFAAALVQLVQWDEEVSHQHHDHRDQPLASVIGVQAMATPPLTARVSRLLHPSHTRDTVMKKVSLATFLFVLICASFFQIRLTTAQEESGEANSGLADLKVIAADVDRQLSDIAARLDLSDQTTDRLSKLIDTAPGKIALAGLLDGLSAQAREQAKLEAFPRFIDQHFTSEGDGSLVIRPEQSSAKERWKSNAARLGMSVNQVGETSKQIAADLDTSTEAGMLFKRLMQDPQAPIAILMNELDGADVVGRYLSDAFEDVFVARGDGSLIVVQSRRDEVSERLRTVEQADQLRASLTRDLPLLAAEYADDDDAHAELVRYLNDPTMASIAAIMLADEAKGPVSAAVDRLHEHFEEISVDTASGLKITDQEAWQQLKEIFAKVDRATALMPRVKDELAQTADSLATDDPLAAKMAEQMKGDMLACMLSANLPNPDVNIGDELRSLLNEVMSETDGKLVINPDREEAIAEKASELLRICRQIRRHLVDVDRLLGEMSDQSFVQTLGTAGRYAMLDEVRRFAEAHRVDPVTLLQKNLLSQTNGDQWIVREDRRDVIRDLVVQSEKVAAEVGNDDF